MGISLTPITTSYSISAGSLIKDEIRVQLNTAKNNAADYGHDMLMTDSSTILGNGQFYNIQKIYGTIQSELGFGNQPPITSNFDIGDIIDDQHVSELITSIEYYSSCHCNYNNYYHKKYCKEVGSCTCNRVHTVGTCTCNQNWVCSCETVYGYDTIDYNYCTVCSQNYTSCKCNKNYGCLEQYKDENQGCACNTDADQTLYQCSSNLGHTSCSSGCTCNTDGCRCNQDAV